MSTIQPGDGYTFDASSSGFSLNIDKPKLPPLADGIILGIDIPPFPDPPLPPDPPAPPSPPTLISPNVYEKPLQFQCNVLSVPVSGVPTVVVQVAMGSVTYSHSLMPLVKTGGFTDYRQAYINFVAVLSTGVAPVSFINPESPWMLGGGGYGLTGEGRWFVTLTKWDAGNAEFDGGLLDANLPWVSFVQDGSAEFDVLFVDQGPSLFENTMNVQKMAGYDAESTGADTDWGHCHTTYFNPRFFGNSTRVLAIIDSIAAVASTAAVTVTKVGGAALGNTIQQITFSGLYKAGGVTFTHDAYSSATAFNPNQTAYDLQICLNTIPSLAGNVYCQQVAPGIFQVEFTNELSDSDVPALGTVSTLTSFDYWYKVSQCAVGSQDVNIPCELGSSQLMNVFGLTEADDPYYVNEATNPKWENVVNHEDAYNANDLGFIPNWRTAVINETEPRAITTYVLDYGQEGGCVPEGDGFLHPFKVLHVETADGLSEYSVISGTVNNIVPGNIASTITVSTGPFDVWVKVPYLAGVYPDATGFVWNIGTPLPADTDDESYIRLASVDGATVTQYITGSLWSDRIKLGTNTATYYFARV